jgi:hypothetical protein
MTRSKGRWNRGVVRNCLLNGHNLAVSGNLHIGSTQSQDPIALQEHLKP